MNIQELRKQFNKESSYQVVSAYTACKKCEGNVGAFNDKYVQWLEKRVMSSLEPSDLVCDCDEPNVMKSDNGVYWCKSCGCYPVIS